jgi:phosphoheptose isomerase
MEQRYNLILVKNSVVTPIDNDLHKEEIFKRNNEAIQKEKVGKYYIQVACGDEILSSVEIVEAKNN